ncbi:MAG TPA: hypothetical protein VN133_10795, partial [Humibacter sp.]|nr:hypothetical protein [Humibacter sp.]
MFRNTMRQQRVADPIDEFLVRSDACAPVRRGNLQRRRARFGAPGRELSWRWSVVHEIVHTEESTKTSGYDADSEG